MLALLESEVFVSPPITGSGGTAMLPLLLLSAPAVTSGPPVTGSAGRVGLPLLFVSYDFTLAAVPPPATDVPTVIGQRSLRGVRRRYRPRRR